MSLVLEVPYNAPHYKYVLHRAKNLVGSGSGLGSASSMHLNGFGPRPYLRYYPMSNPSIRQFQAARKLAADGIVGPTTWAAVEKAVYYPKKPPFKLLTQEQRITYFGDPRPHQQLELAKDGHFRPDPGWQSRSIIQVRKPELGDMPLGWTLIHGISLHHRVTPHFLRMWDLWRKAGLFRCLKTWNGSTVYRLSRGGTGKLSAHAFGIAFDINKDANRYKERCADVGEVGSVMELVTIANACGFYWGGHFSENSMDGMHFEYADISQL